MVHKISLLKQFCHSSGMKINQDKTKFFVINSTAADTEPLVVDDLIVEHCSKYLYLGSPFTADGSITSSVKEHAISKMCNLLKFVSFLKRMQTCLL